MSGSGGIGSRLRGVFTKDAAGFFDRFAQHAALTVKAAEALAEMLGDLKNADIHAAEIGRLEHEADTITHATVATVHGAFVTPIQPNEIQRLIGGLDDIVDFIEATSERLSLYRIVEPTPDVVRMVRVLVAAAAVVREIVALLPDSSKWSNIREASHRVDALESESDDLLRQATARLFDEEQDVKTLMKWKEIYENIENAVDRCADVANIIEGIVLENQ